MQEELKKLFEKFLSQEYGNKITEFNVSGLITAVFMTMNKVTQEEKKESHSFTPDIDMDGM